MIGQILRNLLDNALTHTEPGGKIRVAACVKGQWVEVSVRDTGSGIAAKDRPYVFERYLEKRLSAFSQLLLRVFSGIIRSLPVNIILAPHQST